MPDADDEHPRLLPVDDLEQLVGRVGAVLDAPHLVRDPGLGEVGVEPVEVRALGAVGVDELVVAGHVDDEHRLVVRRRLGDRGREGRLPL